MSLDTESLVRQRAYEIWESENRPNGRDKEHWERALHEVSAAKAPAKAPKATAKPADPAPAKRAAMPEPAPAAVAKRRKADVATRPGSHRLS